MSVIATPFPVQRTIELEDGRVLDPSESQLEPETGTVALADELSTALADEPRHAQDADAFPVDDVTEDELVELYQQHVQQSDDPAAEVSRLGAMIADVIPGAMVTFTLMNHFTFGPDGRLLRDTMAWACLVTSGAAAWHTYASAATVKLAAARAMEAWAFRPQ
jgi:hypothetical protein